MKGKRWSDTIHTTRYYGIYNHDSGFGCTLTLALCKRGFRLLVGGEEVKKENGLIDNIHYVYRGSKREREGPRRH